MKLEHKIISKELCGRGESLMSRFTKDVPHVSSAILR